MRVPKKETISSRPLSSEAVADAPSLNMNQRKCSGSEDSSHLQAGASMHMGNPMGKQAVGWIAAART